MLGWLCLGTLSWYSLDDASHRSFLPPSPLSPSLSSHAGETAFSPSEPFQLVPSAYNKIEMVHRPLTVGTKQVQVHLVDLDTRELVAGWLVTTSSAAPIVSRTYDVDVTVGKSAHKKIAYGTVFCCGGGVQGGVWGVCGLFFLTRLCCLLCVFLFRVVFFSSEQMGSISKFSFAYLRPGHCKSQRSKIEHLGQGKRIHTIVVCASATCRYKRNVYFCQ